MLTRPSPLPGRTAPHRPFPLFPEPTGISMRELERDLPSERPLAVAVVGRGRLGRALSRALRAAGHAVTGPLGRGSDGAGAEVVLLAVPDQEIAAAAALIAPGRLVGHCSGATGLQGLAPHEALGLHPLMTVTHDGADFAGASGAVAGTTPRALATAHRLARDLGLREVVELADTDRAVYHAAASVASNFLVTLQAAAERLAEAAGADRDLLVPLVRATVDNWAAHGAPRALTGPLVRGDELTVARQRAAVEQAAPDLLAVFDALADATRALAADATPGRAA